jgi:phosphoglycerate dehydrogenase-like enzyme
MGLVIAHSRHFEYYADLQRQRRWGPGRAIQHLPDCTLLVIGCGAAGAATAALAKTLGMKVLATDARITSPPPGVDELHPPQALMSLLPRADYVVMIVPETPSTKGMMAAAQFAAMKQGSYLINVGRGSTLVLADLAAALNAGRLAGASLDVFETEPLPADHVLWGMPQVRITPHVSGEGPYCLDRRLEIIVENCRRFAAGEALMNVVDKRNWF